MLSWLWGGGAQKDAKTTPLRRLPNGKVLVVTIDGGGLRGVLPATLLERLNAQAPFLDNVEVFAGTSTGALVAIALAANHSPAAIVDMYEKMSAEVFAHTIFSDLADVEGMLGSSYALGQQNFKKHLEETFGDMTLGDLPRKIIVPAFDLGHPGDGSLGKPLTSWAPRYLTNFGPHAEPTLRVVDCILRTAAAPTYFPTYQNSIDGGMVANNPSMVALSQVVASGVAPLDRIVMLSIGTGLFSQCLEGPMLNWGVIQWAPHLLDIIFDATSEVAAHQCNAMLGEFAFRRVNPHLPSKVGMDDISAISLLGEMAKQLNLEAEVDWLKMAMTKK